MRRALLAIAVVSAFSPVGTAAAADTAADARQEICVETWHHIGELCVHHVVPLTKAVATCVATREDKLSCIPNVGQGLIAPSTR